MHSCHRIFIYNMEIHTDFQYISNLAEDIGNGSFATGSSLMQRS